MGWVCWLELVTQLSPDLEGKNKYRKYRVHFGEQFVPIGGMGTFMTHLKKACIIWFKWSSPFRPIWS